MGSINVQILVGNIGKDPEVRFGSGGNAVCRFPLATSEKWTNGEGELQEKTQWHNVVVFGKTAEACGQHLTKGASVGIVGRTEQRQYDDRDGNTRYITEVIADRVQFLSTSGGSSSGGGSGRGGSGSRGRGRQQDDDEAAF